MLRLVYKALNVKPEEEKQVALMLGHGFFMGIFFATFSVTSETLFLEVVTAEYVNQGIFAAGALGVFTTGSFAILQSRISYSKLTVFNLFLIFGITCTLYYLLQTTPKELEEYKYIVFGLFALNGPLAAVFLLGFWGVFGRMFDLRQSKRIIGGIDTGQLSAAILAFFVIGFLEIQQIEDYLLISAGSILISAFFLTVIIRNYDMEVVKAHEVAQSSLKLTTILKNRYVILLSVFLALSTTSFLFVERSYLTVLDAQFGSRPDQLLQFIAWFSGSILVFSFVFQTFFNDKIIAEYGLKVSLAILPLVLAFFVVATIIMGHVFGFTNDQNGFIWFFLAVALSKLFLAFLRDAMENPAFKLYFMPLDPEIRFDIQAKVEGVVNEFAKVLAGGLILGLGALAFFDLLNYYYILVALIIGWIYVLGKLYAEYRNKIKAKLESQEANLDVDLNSASGIMKDFESDLETSIPSRAIYSFKLMEKLSPGQVNSGINLMMRNDDHDIRDYAQRKMNEIRGVSVSDKYVITYKTVEDAEGKQVVKGDDLNALLNDADIPTKRISKLCRSSVPEDRQYGAELIGNSTSTEILSYLIELLRDIDTNVRLAAINTAEKRYNREILMGLIGSLADPRFGNVAMNALVIIGHPALETLDAGYYRTGQNFQTMRKIIQIMGRIGGSRAKQLLWNKIDFPDKVLASQVLKSLGECGFKADFNQITRIKFEIESDVEDVAWNLAAYYEVPNTSDGQIVKNALEEENNHDIEHIYTLLAMLYDPKSIRLVKENLDSGTSEGVTFAVELLDVFLSEDLKQRVIPILDDVGDSEKIKKLEGLYPRASLGSREVVKLIINREFNQTNRWTKACALHLIGTLHLKEYIYDLIANLFNPDILVMEVAAWSLYQIDPKEFESNINRLDERWRRHLWYSIAKAETSSLGYDRVLYLKGLEMFEGMPGLILSELVDVLEERTLEPSDSIPLMDENGEYFYIVRKGTVDIYQKGEVVHSYTQDEFIGEIVVGEETFNSNKMVARDNAVIWHVAKDQFYSLLSDNIDIARKVVTFLRVA